MSFVTPLMIGRFDFRSDTLIQPLEMEQFAAVFTEFADREADGSLPSRHSSRDGTRTTIGWLNGSPIIFDSRGFLSVQINWTVDGRFSRFLAYLIERLDCDVYGWDGGEFEWTTEVLRRSKE
jgi:hypothetical protein